MDNSKIKQHISEKFNQNLDAVNNKVLVMGGLVEQQIDQAMRAFTTSDKELAQLVIKQESQIDQLEIAIDQECVRILALHQPAAFDLRFLLTVIKVINELETIGDLAERIAKMTIQLPYHAQTPKDPYHELQHMTVLAKKMLHDALDAFARMSIDGITDITGCDETVDREYASIVRQLSEHIIEDPNNISRTLTVSWIARAMERIGDHACYICDHVIYMIKAEAVQHLSQSELEEKFNGHQELNLVD
jgi:phosphate transport system protein